MALDGVYVQTDDDTPVFLPAPELTNDDVRQIVETTAHRVIGLPERSRVLDGDDLDRLADESPVLAGMNAASLQGLVATGKRAGMRVRKALSDPADAVRSGDLCFVSRGFSIHAATQVDAGDRDSLERLCRYVARPPLAAGRLERISDEALSFRLKTPWDDGTTHLILSPIELLEKLAAMVPPPRINLVRYHGVLGPNAKDRDKIVPAGKQTAETSADEDAAPRKYRLAWSALLARVFQIDMEKCPHCGGKMRIVAALTDPASIRQYLEGTGQSAEVPVLAPARDPPQIDLDFEL